MRSLLSLVFLPAVATFECWSCGVFLKAPTSSCSGQPKNVTCPTGDLGCIYITAENPDGTYYVEKNCVQPDDPDEMKVEGCKSVAIRGMTGTSCVCKEELCNGGLSQSIAWSLIFATVSLAYRNLC